jgi:signal peptidase II
LSFFGVSGVLVFVLDQVTKSVIQHGLENRPLRLGRIVTLRFLSSSKRYYRAAPIRAAMSIVWILAAGAALLLALITDKSASPWLPIAMGSAVGGAAGNLLDVLQRRAVRDFIDLGWWPVFNLADVAIIAGVAGMLIGR